jgi:hypothetical protein
MLSLAIVTVREHWCWDSSRKMLAYGWGFVVDYFWDSLVRKISFRCVAQGTGN